LLAVVDLEPIKQLTLVMVAVAVVVEDLLLEDLQD
jgi:hypothetical protein